MPRTVPSPSVNPFIVPTLSTERLLIRELQAGDLDACHALFIDIGWANPDRTAAENHAERRAWLIWTIDSYREHARLYQPPFGERAAVRKASGQFIGLVGYSPSFEPFGRLSAFGDMPSAGRTMELGLFWAICPADQGKGYATEAARALVDHAFRAMTVARIIATTTHDNAASIAVMARLGMRIESYQYPHPGLQVVGVLAAR